MIELNDDNDPLLFAIRLPNGTLICQYMEIVATVQALAPNNMDPSMETVVAAIRKSARTPEVAKAADDSVLIAAWHRMTKAMEASGKA
jgi:hypothetical protein